MNQSITSSAEKSLPQGALIGAGALVIASLVMVIGVRVAGYLPAKPAASAVVQSYALRFVDRPDGAVLIYSASDGRLVDTLAPGTNGFVRGVMRGLVRGRRADHFGPEAAFRLTRWADGRLSLDDPDTGRHVDLEVFGPTNAGAFADILIKSGQLKDPS